MATTTGPLTAVPTCANKSVTLEPTGVEAPLDGVACPLTFATDAAAALESGSVRNTISCASYRPAMVNEMTCKWKRNKNQF